jgi:DNA-binding NarL/FixJ family response regulator
MTRVLTVADDPLTRRALVALFDGRPDTVVTPLGCRPDAIRSALDLMAPDLVLLVLDTPDLTLLADILATRMVTTAILTDIRHEDHAVPALVMGARAFLYRDRPTGWLLEALDRTLDGQTVVDPAVASHLVHAATHHRRIDGPFGLTRQEEQVVSRLHARRTNHEIGRSLGISHNTVKSHLAAAFRKLGVHDREEAAVFAASHGLA